MRRPILAAALLAACSWELPRPARGPDAGDASTDALNDRSTPNDLVAPPDAPRIDVVGEDRVDAVARDLASPDDVVDVALDRVAPTDRVAADVVDVVAPQDVVDVVSVDVTMTECAPGTRRVCYTGSPASRGVGTCRDGVQTCLPTGRWPNGCDGQVLPDCASRVCGSDGCGGACGACASGQLCDDTGRCVARVCGASNFTITCPDSTRCPRDSHCAGGGRCECDEGYAATTCGDDACGACAFPDWWCRRAFFCGGGAIACPGGYLCPVRSRCEASTRSCQCEAGFVAVDCGGNRCTACPGVSYRCVPG